MALIDPQQVNKLNELSGKEWIKFTKSWMIVRPPPRREKILHPACFPETLAEDFIRFFTKTGAWVLDPFLGTGSTLLAARNTKRNGVGIEIYREYVQMSRERLGPTIGLDLRVIEGDSRNIKDIVKLGGLPEFDFCLTSPPYWNQLQRRSFRQRERTSTGLHTEYGYDENDLGTVSGYELFLKEQKRIFDSIYSVMKERAYLVIITNNVFANGRLYPLAFDTVAALSEKWTPKDEKIWLQDDKRLLPLGIRSAWVGNRHHQYCLIFRKEN